jgi:hypothetical protein
VALISYVFGRFPAVRLLKRIAKIAFNYRIPNVWLKLSKGQSGAFLNRREKQAGQWLALLDG